MKNEKNIFKLLIIALSLAGSNFYLRHFNTVIWLRRERIELVSAIPKTKYCYLRIKMVVERVIKANPYQCDFRQVEKNLGFKIESEIHNLFIQFINFTKSYQFDINLLTNLSRSQVPGFSNLS